MERTATRQVDGEAVERLKAAGFRPMARGEESRWHDYERGKRAAARIARDEADYEALVRAVAVMLGV